jgi:DNA-binding NarL/FixJ family response regulator
VVDAMRRIIAGERYVAPGLRTAPPATTTDEGGPGLLAPLSRREREVFWLLMQGHSTQAVAHALCVSVKTVETHRAHINRKLGVHSTAALLRLAARSGLLPDGRPPTGDHP